MTSLVFLAFNVLLLMLVWEFFFKKAWLDNQRDKLFDLRSQLRAVFASKNALDSDAYRETRDLLNAQIALTENLSILQYFLLAIKIDSNKRIKQGVESRNALIYFTEDLELRDAIKETRINASTICMEYMILSSIALTLVLITTVVLVAIGILVKNFFINCKEMFTKAYRKSVYAEIFNVSTSKLNLKQEIIEDASILLRFGKS